MPLTMRPSRPTARKNPSVPAQRVPWDVLLAVSVGGGLGALARYGMAVAVPHAATDFPWSTFGVNVVGCLVLAAITTAFTERHPVHRLVRPFLGVGLLGGFTTFSTYVLDGMRLALSGHYGTAVLYVLGTLGAALVAVFAGIAGTRRALLWRAAATTGGRS